MSSLTTRADQKHEWLVTLPDLPNALQKRRDFRQEHWEGLEKIYPADFWIWGGGTFDELPTEGSSPSFTGSVLLVYANSKDTVIDLLKQDEYTTQGVWDWDKAHITLFRTAIRKNPKE